LITPLIARSRKESRNAMPVSEQAPQPGANSGIQNIVRGGSQTISGQQSTGAGSRLEQHIGGPAAGDGEPVTLADLAAAILALRLEFARLLDREPDALSGAAAVTADRALAEAAAQTESGAPQRDALRGAIDRTAATLGSVGGLGSAVAALLDIFRKLFGG
jgi:hypothetical protein